MYLRAQQLVPKYKPTILIFNFILDDLARCTQYVRQGAAKPYFDFKDDGSLVIRNQPVHFLKNTRLDWFRRVFGYSYLCHKIMSKFFPVYWYGGTSGNDNRYVPNDPYTVSMLILDKVAQMGIDYHMRVMIVVQAENFVNEESVRFVTPMLEYVQENHPNVEVINTLPFFLKMKNSDPEAFNKFYVEVNSHPSAQGNQVFAYLLASLIKSPQSDH